MPIVRPSNPEEELRRPELFGKQQEVEYVIVSTRLSSRSRAGDGGRDGGGADNDAFGTRSYTLNKGPRGLGQRHYQRGQNVKKSMTQVELTAVKKAAGLIEEKQSGKDGNRDMLKKIGQYLESTYQEVKGLKEIIIEQGKMIKEQSEMIRAQSSTIQALQTQVEAIESQSIEEASNSGSS
uniref:Uncharacterized protein n=1 Tax=Talaromyces marneffei PM1 TaxID=1077442 RepID=A0A093XK07_TALMA